MEPVTSFSNDMLVGCVEGTNAEPEIIAQTRSRAERAGRLLVTGSPIRGPVQALPATVSGCTPSRRSSAAWCVWEVLLVGEVRALQLLAREVSWELKLGHVIIANFTTRQYLWGYRSVIWSERPDPKRYDQPESSVWAAEALRRLELDDARRASNVEKLRVADIHKLPPPPSHTHTSEEIEEARKAAVAAGWIRFPEEEEVLHDAFI